MTNSSLANFVYRPMFDKAVILKRDAQWPKLTIVTPSYNQGRFLERTLLSILNQNYPNLELIVMDGGSTDDSATIIQRYERYIQHWQSKPDKGQAAALADGFALASGDILAYLNSDDVYLPGALKMVGTFFKEHPAINFVYGDCLVIDPNDEVIRRMCPPDFDRNIFLYENNIVPQPSAFWRKGLYLRAGGIDQSFSFCMDYDLMMKFIQIGERPVRVKQVLSGFRWHLEAKTSRLEATRRREYARIFHKVTGMPFEDTDPLQIAYCRLKRYCIRPRAMVEALRGRLKVALTR